MEMWSIFVCLFVVVPVLASEVVPPYIKQCYEGDTEVLQCFKKAIHHLRPYLEKGIKEIELPSVEPFKMDELSLSLTTGPNGYKISLKNIDVLGASKFTVKSLRSDIETNQYQFTMYIPKITAKARYESSGVLILVQASGGGNYWGEYEGVKIKVYLKGSPRVINDKTYLIVQQMKMDFSVKDIKMGVDGIHNGNTVLQAALNLFINSNSQELLKEMKPHLKKKLLILMRNFADKVFSQVPYEAFIA
uniref:Protein takeout-like n=1 Tax=Diabrotica virgifera virgifera TaxID=50390 RepID=A0A6P7GYV5_DIAVI